MKISANEIKIGNILEIDNKLWKVLKLYKSSYIVNKDVEAWLCLAKKN